MIGVVLYRHNQINHQTQNIMSNQTSAEFIKANQSAINEIIDAPYGDRIFTELKLRDLFRNSYTAGFDAGIDKMSAAAKELYAR